MSTSGSETGEEETSEDQSIDSSTRPASTDSTECFDECFVNEPHLLTFPQKRTEQEISKRAEGWLKHPDSKDGLLRYPLHWFATQSASATSQHFDTLQALLQANPGAAAVCDGCQEIYLPVPRRKPLHYLLAHCGQATEWTPKMVTALREAHAEAASGVDGLGMSALHCLAQDCHANEHSWGIFQNLLSADREAASICDKAERLALHLLAEGSRNATEYHCKMLDSLIELNPDASQKRTNRERTALHCLMYGSQEATEHNVKMLQRLLDANLEAASTADGDGRFPLQLLAEHACGVGATDHTWAMFDLMLKTCPAAASAKNSDGQSLLHAIAGVNGALSELYARMLAAVLEVAPGAAATRDGLGRSPLHLLLANRAGANEHTLRCCNALLAAHPPAAAEADASGTLALVQLAGRTQDSDEAALQLVEAVLAACPEAAGAANAARQNALHCIARRSEAVSSRCVAIVQRIAALHPPACAAADRAKRHPLHLLAMRGRVFAAAEEELASALLAAHPAAASSADADGMLPLALLVQDLALMSEERFRVFEALLAAHPDALKAADKHGRLPLHLMAAGCVRATEHGWRAWDVALERYPEGAGHVDKEGRHALGCFAASVEQGLHGDRTRLEFSVHSVDVITEHYWRGRGGAPASSGGGSGADEEVVAGGCTWTLEEDGAFGGSADFRQAARHGWTCVSLQREEPAPAVAEALWRRMEALFAASPAAARTTRSRAGGGGGGAGRWSEREVLVACLRESDAPVRHLRALVAADPEAVRGKALPEVLAAECASPRRVLVASLLSCALGPREALPSEKRHSVGLQLRREDRWQQRGSAEEVREAMEALLAAEKTLLASDPGAGGGAGRTLCLLLEDLAEMGEARWGAVEAVLKACPEAVSAGHGKMHPLHVAVAGCLGATELGLKALRAVLRACPEAAGLEDKQGRTPMDILAKVMERAAHGDSVQLEFSVHSARILKSNWFEENDDGDGSDDGSEIVAKKGPLWSLEEDGSWATSAYRGATCRGWKTLELGEAGPEPGPMLREAHWELMEELLLLHPRALKQTELLVVECVAKSGRGVELVQALLRGEAAAGGGDAQGRSALQRLLALADRPASELLGGVVRCLLQVKTAEVGKARRQAASGSQGLPPAEQLELYEALVAAAPELEVQAGKKSERPLETVVGELSTMGRERFAMFEKLLARAREEEETKARALVAAAKGCAGATEHGWRAFAALLDAQGAAATALPHSTAHGGGLSVLEWLCKNSAGVGKAGLGVFEQILQRYPQEEQWRGVAKRPAVLHLADASAQATEAQWHMFEVLAERQASLSAAEKREVVALLSRRAGAATEFNLLMLEKALACGMPADEADAWGRLPLHLLAGGAKAASAHSKAMLEALLKTHPAACTHTVGTSGAFDALSYLLQGAEDGTEHHGAMLAALLDAHCALVKAGAASLQPLVSASVRLGLLRYLQAHLEGWVAGVAAPFEEGGGGDSEARTAAQGLVLLYLSAEPSAVAESEVDNLRDGLSVELVKHLRKGDMAMLGEGGRGFKLFASAVVQLVPAPCKDAHLGGNYGAAERAWRTSLICTDQGVTWLSGPEGRQYLEAHAGVLDADGLGVTHMVDPLSAKVENRDDLTTMPLRTVNVSNNPELERIPLGLCEIAALEQIDCKECKKLSSPPAEIIEQGGAAVVQFLKALYKDGVKNQEMLLFLIGNGEAGKTSVKNALMSSKDTSPKIKEDSRSVGISVSLWALPSEFELAFKILDLAGQAVYASTNQFFLTPRAVYVLVWRAKEVDMSLPVQQRADWSPEAMVESWMDLLQFRVPGASVAVVVTHIDQVSEAALELQVKQVSACVQERTKRMKVPLQFLARGESVRVNCLDGTGVALLRQKLIEFGKSRPWYDEYLPKSWLDLQELLRASAEEQPYISWDAYKKVAAGAKLEERDLPMVTKFLNETGSIRYFGDYEGEAKGSEGADHFAATVYVSPPWIIGVMKGLIRHNHENLRRFFLSVEDEDLGLEMERLTRKLVVHGVLHAELIPFLWPLLSEVDPTPKGQLCTVYWDSVLGEASESDEKEVWGDQRIVARQTDLAAAVGLLDGFNLAGKISDTEWIVPLMMMKGGAVSVDKDALKVAGCGYRTEIVLSLMPPGLVEGLMVRLRKRCNFGEMSPTHAVFCSRGSTVKVQVVKGDDELSSRVVIMADTKKMAMAADAEFKHLVRFYPGLDHSIKTSATEDGSDPTDVIVIFRRGCKYQCDLLDSELNVLSKLDGDNESDDDDDDDDDDESDDESDDDESDDDDAELLSEKGSTSTVEDENEDDGHEASKILVAKLSALDDELTLRRCSERDDLQEDYQARVALVLLDEKFHENDACLRHFRWAVRNAACIIPVLLKGFKTRKENSYDTWWPTSMEELSGHSLFANCTGDVAKWGVGHVYEQVMMFIEERSRWQGKEEEEAEEPTMTECAQCIKEMSPNPGVLREKDLKVEFASWRHGASKDRRIDSCNHKFSQHVHARIAGKGGQYPCPQCARERRQPAESFDAHAAAMLFEDWTDHGKQKAAFQQIQANFQGQGKGQAAPALPAEEAPAEAAAAPYEKKVKPLPEMTCAHNHRVQVLDLLEHSIMGNTDMVPCFRCVEQDAPFPGQFSRSKILEEHKAALDPTGALGEKAQAQAVESCGNGHRVNVVDILSKAAICKALPCPRCQAHGSIPPGWFKRDACLLCRADNITGSSGVMVCYECHKNGRDPRVPVVEIMKPEVFLSYDWGVGRRNQAKVSKLHRSVELKTGLHCWMDIKGGMGAGQSEKVEMRKAVQGSTVVVVFFSFRYLRSDNCIREIAHALLWQKHIVPVLLPDWGSEQRDLEPELEGTELPWLDYTGKDWWRYAQTFGKAVEPDSKYPVAWEQLQRFEPIALGSAVDMEDSAADLPEARKREIIDRVFQRFHRTSPAMAEAEAAFSRLRNALLHDLRAELARHALDSDAIFAQLDTDGSGDISFEELRAWGEARGWRFTEANLRRLYCEFPQSDRGMLDRAAFQTYCLSFMPPAPTAAARRQSVSGRPVSRSGRPVSQSGRRASQSGRRASQSSRPVSQSGRPTSKAGLRQVGEGDARAESPSELRPLHPPPAPAPEALPPGETAPMPSEVPTERTAANVADHAPADTPKSEPSGEGGGSGASAGGSGAGRTPEGEKEPVEESEVTAAALEAKRLEVQHSQAELERAKVAAEVEKAKAAEAAKVAMEKARLEAEVEKARLDLERQRLLATQPRSGCCVVM